MRSLWRDSSRAGTRNLCLSKVQAMASRLRYEKVEPEENGPTYSGCGADILERRGNEPRLPDCSRNFVKAHQTIPLYETDKIPAENDFPSPLLHSVPGVCGCDVLVLYVVLGRRL